MDRHVFLCNIEITLILKKMNVKRGVILNCWLNSYLQKEFDHEWLSKMNVGKSFRWKPQRIFFKGTTKVLQCFVVACVSISTTFFGAHLRSEKFNGRKIFIASCKSKKKFKICKICRCTAYNVQSSDGNVWCVRSCWVDWKGRKEMAPRIVR